MQSHLLTWQQSSTCTAAIGDRLHDAWCLYVVSFSSIIPRVPSFIIVTYASDLPLCTVKCCSAVFVITLRLLVNCRTLCHRPPPSTVSVINLPWYVAAECIALGTHTSSSHRSIARYSSRIDAPIGGGVPLEYCHDVWCGKTRMVWLPDGEKKLEDMFIRFDRIHKRDGQTDTAWRHRRLHSIMW